MTKHRLHHIRRNDSGGIDVYTSAGTFRNVVENIVRCEVGRDFDYLMEAEDEFFNISDSAIEDFEKYQE